MDLRARKTASVIDIDPIQTRQPNPNQRRKTMAMGMSRSSTTVFKGMDLIRPAILKPEVIEECAKIAKTSGDKLPKDASEERMHRNRMAADTLDLMMRRGHAVETVADQIALRVVEQWCRLVQGKAKCSEPQLAPTICDLVHGGKMELPPEPLRSALLRVVPKDAEERWDFIEELKEIFEIEGKFDRSSMIHTAPGIGGRGKLSIKCGRPPPVWEFETKPRSTFGRVPVQKERVTTVLCDRNMMNWAHMPVPRSSGVPGPGSYTEKVCEGMICPKRAEFACFGKPRAQCLVSLLSQRPRMSHIRDASD